MAEIIDINLALQCQLMVEIETVEGESSLWTIECCRKPACSQKLDMSGNNTILATITKVNGHLVYSREIDDGKQRGLGGRARAICTSMAKCNTKTSLVKR